MNKYGFIRVGASTIELEVANPTYNVKKIKEQTC